MCRLPKGERCLRPRCWCQGLPGTLTHLHFFQFRGFLATALTNSHSSKSLICRPERPQTHACKTTRTPLQSVEAIRVPLPGRRNRVRSILSAPPRLDRPIEALEHLLPEQNLIIRVLSNVCFRASQSYYVVVSRIPRCTAGPPPEEVRTSAQIERKRARDRESQRLGRERNKERMVGIEKELSDLRSRYDALLELTKGNCCDQAPAAAESVLPASSPSATQRGTPALSSVSMPPIQATTDQAPSISMASEPDLIDASATLAMLSAVANCNESEIYGSANSSSSLDLDTSKIPSGRTTSHHCTDDDDDDDDDLL